MLISWLYKVYFCCKRRAVLQILIIGSPASIYTKYYITEVLLPLNANVFLSYNKKISDEDRKFYEKKGVVLVNLYEKSGALGRLPKISNLLCYLKNLKKYTLGGRIDCIHIHYIGNPKLMKYSYLFLRKYSSRLIATFWGSDILDIDRKRANQIKGLMTVSDKIVLSTYEMRKKFRDYYGNAFDEKIEACLFGNAIIEAATKKQERTNTKKDKNKLIISIGYNGSKRQQHLKVLEELNKLSNEIKEKIFIIIQMSYGINDLSYKGEVEQKMNDYELDGEIIEEYLNIEETIELKSNVDLFINSQKTDALSSSVLEYMYFGAEVLNPEWINYRDWTDLDISFNKYKEFSDINKWIIKLLEGEKPTNHRRNKEIIEHNFTWKHNAKKWQSLYEIK